MQTQYNHYSDEELLGFKHLVSGDNDFTEELCKRLAANVGMVKKLRDSLDDLGVNK